MKVELGPVTRLEGHLNVKTEVADNRVVDARCEGEMFRGFERILQGRHPLDAQQITQRICGICPYAHALASSYAQEAAYNISAPENGRILQNLIQGANHLYDYLLNFYQLSAIDFIDVTAILKYSGNDRDLNHLKAWVQHKLASGKSHGPAPFLPRLQGDYVESAEINIGALNNYIKSLEIQRKSNQASAIFGGKFPHSTSIFPGGCTQEARIDLILAYKSMIEEVRAFIHNNYLADIKAVASLYPEYWTIGASKGGFLSAGLFPRGPEADTDRLFSAGFVTEQATPAAPFALDDLTEETTHSRYALRGPSNIKDGTLVPDPSRGYSWIKAPRYQGQAMEVGPSARLIVSYHHPKDTRIKEVVDGYLQALNLRVSHLNSVLGRHLSRGINAVIIADYLLEACEQLTPGEPTMAEYKIPASGEGMGMTEASRGALLHYLRVRKGVIDKYECVVPTTWNCSPRDGKDVPGALESALIGLHVASPEQQLESLRVIHSFDPCLACAVH
nr:nickel-dependent hydrogenase large subunit [uncultured Desulfobulbus sp.]